MVGLTKKQEAFVQAVMTASNYSDAYRSAYDCDNMTDKTINEKASIEAKKGKVKARIEELRDRAEKATDITMERIIRELGYIAFQDVTSLYSNDWTINLDNLTAEQRATIAGLEVVTGDISTITKLKTCDKLQALDKLVRILGGYEQEKILLHDIRPIIPDLPEWSDPDYDGSTDWLK